MAPSAGSSGASGWTMLVLPALAFAGGLIHLWTVASIVGCMWLLWVVTAKRLRRYTHQRGHALTIPEFWEKRFGDTSGAPAGHGRGHKSLLHHAVRLLGADLGNQAPRGTLRPGPHRNRP